MAKEKHKPLTEEDVSSDHGIKWVLYCDVLNALRGLKVKTRKLRGQLVKGSASYQVVRECEKCIKEQFQLKDD